MRVKNAADALQELMDGNQRYIAGKLMHPRQTPQHRRELLAHQEPFASILGCADSRVPPEVIFDQGVGDLFVVRVAGNVIDAVVLESLEYAVVHLETPLLLVLGHRNCGAVKATVDAIATGEEGEGHLRHIVNAIRPAVTEVQGQSGDLLDNAICANIRGAVKQLRSAFLQMVREQRLKIVGAYYNLESGRVELLEITS